MPNESDRLHLSGSICCSCLFCVSRVPCFSKLHLQWKAKTWCWRCLCEAVDRGFRKKTRAVPAACSHLDVKKGSTRTSSSRCSCDLPGHLLSANQVPIKGSTLSVSFLEDYILLNFSPGLFPWDLGLLQRCVMEIFSFPQVPSQNWIRISRFKERLDQGTLLHLVIWLCKQSASCIIKYQEELFPSVQMKINPRRKLDFQQDCECHTSILCRM